MSHQLTQEAQAVDRDVTALGLPLEVFQQETGSREVIRLYLTSQSLGGLLAVNHGEGWVPCYPERPNYPYHGTWYSPGHQDWTPTDWKTAVMAALNPPDPWSQGSHPHHPLKRLAVDRAQALRHPLRAAMAAAIIRQATDEDGPDYV
mgnify:CR=1 FL=1